MSPAWRLRRPAFASSLASCGAVALGGCCSRALRAWRASWSWLAAAVPPLPPARHGVAGSWRACRAVAVLPGRLRRGSFAAVAGFRAVAAAGCALATGCGSRRRCRPSLPWPSTWRGGCRLAVRPVRPCRRGLRASWPASVLQRALRRRRLGVVATGAGVAAAVVAAAAAGARRVGLTGAIARGRLDRGGSDALGRARLRGRSGCRPRPSRPIRPRHRAAGPRPPDAMPPIQRRTTPLARTPTAPAADPAGPGRPRSQLGCERRDIVRGLGRLALALRHLLACLLGGGELPQPLRLGRLCRGQTLLELVQLLRRATGHRGDGPVGIDDDIGDGLDDAPAVVRPVSKACRLLGHRSPSVQRRATRAPSYSSVGRPVETDRRQIASLPRSASTRGSLRHAGRR